MAPPHADSNLSLLRSPSFVTQTKLYLWTHYLHILLILLLWRLWVSATHSPAHDMTLAVRWIMHVSFVTETARPKAYVDVTTVIKYLLPGSTTTNTGVLGPEVIRSTLFLAVFVTFASWPVNTALAVARASASRSCWPLWPGGLFVGGRDDFSREVQPDRIHQCQTTRVVIT